MMSETHVSHPSQMDTTDVADQITFMISKLSEDEKRRTFELQPLMSSTMIEQSPTPESQ